MPWDFSLSTRKLSIKLSMRITVNRHALDAAISLTLVGIEEAVQALVMDLYYRT